MTHDAAALLVRPASERDTATIARLAEEAGMGVLTPRGTSYVAVSEGRVVGFIRIVEAGGDRYVNPIVVAASAQRQGALGGSANALRSAAVRRTRIGGPLLHGAGMRARGA